MQTSTRQCTIAQAGSVAGVGLHSGCEVRLTLLPAPANHGLKFQRLDLATQPVIAADIDNAGQAERHTLISHAGCQILTTEHVLSALYGTGIDNVLITLTACETPLCDGSARPFVDLIKRCGIVEQDEQRNVLEVRYMLRLSLPNATEYIVLPQARGLRISCVYEDNVGPISQHESTELTRALYDAVICDARTFVWWQDVEPLVAQGLVKGGSLDNAVVLSRDLSSPLDGIDWRCSNELVKHKMLDLIGDLALLGQPLNAHIIAIRPGHKSNAMLVKALRAHCSSGAGPGDRQHGMLTKARLS